ncbi:MAG: penicillin-binding protein 1C [Pseudomonadota bacterium]
MFHRVWRSLAWLLIGGAVFLTVAIPAAAIAFDYFDRNNPPLLADGKPVSPQVLDRDGKLLRAFVSSDGFWRLPVSLDNVDGEYVKMLLAFEDKRFWNHPGVDPVAFLRAFGQFVTNRRIVSGGSTITMQYARLLTEDRQRSLRAKLRQIVLALQIERRLTKQDILTRYLAIAPYGGNIEGVRAASLAWFGKEPKGLSVAESALLVALPQSPERRRPDRFRNRAQKARDTVLRRMASGHIIAASEVARAARSRVPAVRRAMPKLAAHLANRLIGKHPDQLVHRTRLKRSVQKNLELLALEKARSLGPERSLALVMADSQTGDIVTQIGSPDMLDERRSGWIDMSEAVRSPGSTLKPFIYALAFDDGVVRPATHIFDTPVSFSGYRPQNFDLAYQGEVSVRTALQLSLNVPAVKLLESVGPLRLIKVFQTAGAVVDLPKGKVPGLAIGLGGLGISLKDLVQLYAGLANGGTAISVSATNEDDRKPVKSFMSASASWYVTDILKGAPPPAGYRNTKIAYKTGTSYGYRDAWSIGYDGRYVIGVWVGRADNSAVPGMTGQKTAAPILFEAFERSGVDSVPFGDAPASVQRLAHSQLPITLRYFRGKSAASAFWSVPEPAPSIVFPPHNARLEIAKSPTGQWLPVIAKVQDGRPPFRWMVNNRPSDHKSRRRESAFHPDGEGYSRLTVIDAAGRSAAVDVFITRAKRRSSILQADDG